MWSLVVVQVILAPIIEPPSQTGQEEGFSETPQYALLNEAFGYMNTGGYCATVGFCKNFPIMPEIGSPMTSINDNLMMGSLFNYMNATGLGRLLKMCLCFIAFIASRSDKCAPSFAMVTYFLSILLQSKPASMPASLM